MNLSRRVRAVEAKLGAAAVCPACKGEGSKPAVMVWMPDEQPKPERPRCRVCGEPARNVTMVIIESVNQPGAGTPA